MLKRVCLLSLMTIATLTPPAMAGGNHKSRHTTPVEPAQPAMDWSSGYGYGYANPDYGYWENSPPQFSNQAASANAIATGNGSTATSNVNQFNYQSHYGNSGYSGNRYGYWAVPSIQISVQQGTANAVSTGNGSTAASHLNQLNQNGAGNYAGNDYGGYWGNPQAQSSQQAIGNAVASGDHSTAISNIDQYNYQNYGYPTYPDYGYGYGY